MIISKNKLPIGSIAWTDLTVNNTEQIRDFYSLVVGWKTSEVPTGDYGDYNMNSPDDNQTKAGVCHSRCVNAGLPPFWLVYITVEDVDASAAFYHKLSAKIIVPPKKRGGLGRYCVIQDPAGAFAALYESKK